MTEWFTDGTNIYEFVMTDDDDDDWDCWVYSDDGTDVVDLGKGKVIRKTEP